MKTYTYNDIEHRAGAAFESEEDAQAWGGPVVRLKGIQPYSEDGDVHHPLCTTNKGANVWVNADRASSFGGPENFARFAPLYPKPEPFENARAMYRHMGVEDSKMVAARTGVAFVLGGRWWHEAGGADSGGVGPSIPGNWRPFCPVWDAPAPTAEEIRAEAIAACRSDVLAVLASYGCTWSNTGPSGGIVNRHLFGDTIISSPYAPNPGWGLAIDFRNCTKPTYEEAP